MKPVFSLLLFSMLILLSPVDISAVVAVHPEHQKETLAKERAKEAYEKLNARQKKKLKRKLSRLKRKGKMKKAGADMGFLEDSRFRLGLIVFGAGIVLLLLWSLFIGFGGFISWVGGLAVFVGFVLMIWALIEYFV